MKRAIQAPERAPLAYLAHELRNLLAPMAASVRLARQGRDDSDVLLELVEDQFCHLSRLIDDLDDMDRIEARPVDLAEIVVRRLELARPLLKQKLLLEVPGVPVMVMADPARLHQVVCNLLTNAMRYTPPEGRISLRLSTRKKRAVLEISDTGIGIEPSVRQAIFEPFTRGRTGRGMGVGLALVKKLVELQSGSVEVASPGTGLGSTFTVRFPLLLDTPVPEPAPEVRSRPHRVLLVEDNAVASLSTRLLLESWGHTVETASDGAETLEAARRFQPTLIFLDLVLRDDTDGHDLLAGLRKISQAAIVGLSGHARDLEAEKARSVRFDAYLRKPPDLRELRQVLKQTEPG